jgi:hypothetical protein
MIKRFMVLAVASVMLFSASVFAASQQEAEAMCRQYAQEDGIQSDEMESYLAQCVQDLTAE